MVVVVLAAVLVGLYAAKVGPFAPSTSPSSSSGGGSGAGETFKAAATTATPAAATVSGGPWSLVGGTGVQLSASVTINQTLLNESFDFGCHTHALPGAATLTSFPATTSSSSSGDSNLWVVIFGNSSGYALEVAVISGVATPVLIVPSFQTCGTSSGLLSLPSDIEDSPSPAAAAWSGGGSGYAANQSTYDVEMIVLNVTGFGGPVWVVTYTNCNPSEPTSGATLDGKSPAEFTSVFDAVNGTRVYATNTSTSCPVLSGSSSGGGGGGGGSGKPSISGCEMISIPENITGTYWYNASAVCPFNVTKMTTGDVSISAVNNTTGLAVSSTAGWSLVIQNVSTYPYVNVSQYNFATKSWNDTTYPILALGDSDYWVLTTPTNVSGDRLVITATSSAPCTGSFDWFLNQVLA